MNSLTKLQHLSLGVGSALAGACVLTATAEAAVFSRVIGEFQADFNQPALPNSSSALADIFTQTIDGPVIATSEAAAAFVTLPDKAAELDLAVFSEVSGDSSSLFGLANGETSASGVFFIDQGETFAFDFSLSLELLTSIDNPETESAFAFGNFIFPLFSQGLIDQESTEEFSFLSALQLSAILDTVLDESDFPELFIGDDFEIISEIFQVDNTGLDQGITINITGSYEQTFEQATLIRVQQASFDAVAIAQAVPTPSLLWGILSMGLIGVVKQGRQVLEKKVVA